MGRRTVQRLVAAGAAAIVIMFVGLCLANSVLVIISMVLAGGTLIRLLSTWE